MTEITIDPMALATIAMITGIVVQYVKKIKFISDNSDIIPLVSMLVGGIIGGAASFFMNVDLVQGAIAGVIASGGYSLLKGMGAQFNVIKKSE